MACRKIADRSRKQQRVPRGQEPDGTYDLVRTRSLEQESRSSGPQGVKDVVIVVEGGEDEDARGVVDVGEQAAGCLDAINGGHADVHQHDIGAQAAHQGRDGRSGLGFADHRDVGLGVDDRPQTAADERFVVDEEDPQIHGVGCSGSRTATRQQPASGPAET